MLTSVHSYSAAGATNWSAPAGFLAHKCLEHQHNDCFVPGHSHAEIYSRPRFEAVEIAPRLAPGTFESTRFTIGDQPADSDTAWKADVKDTPKDCYYCKGSGDCPNDSAKYGKGKDYMDQTCNSCSGSGKCSHCDGDGVIG